METYDVEYWIRLTITIYLHHDGLVCCSWWLVFCVFFLLLPDKGNKCSYAAQHSHTFLIQNLKKSTQKRIQSTILLQTADVFIMVVVFFKPAAKRSL